MFKYLNTPSKGSRHTDYTFVTEEALTDTAFYSLGLVSRAQAPTLSRCLDNIVLSEHVGHVPRHAEHLVGGVGRGHEVALALLTLLRLTVSGRPEQRSFIAVH